MNVCRKLWKVFRGSVMPILVLYLLNHFDGACPYLPRVGSRSGNSLVAPFAPIDSTYSRSPMVISAGWMGRVLRLL